MPQLNALTVFEDDDLFIIDKPPQLHSVQSGPNGGASLADLLLATHPFLSEVASVKGDAGLVQRLDFSTSGLLVGAKSREMWLALHQQLLKGHLFKCYVALVHGTPVDTLDIATYIGSPYRHPTKMRIYEKDPPTGHRALYGSTTFRLIESLGTAYALVKATASPARRHQVRVHSAHLGHCLVGDSLYGSTSNLQSILGIDRDFFLHACEISFHHPRTDQLVAVTSPYDEELKLFRLRLSAR